MLNQGRSRIGGGGEGEEDKVEEGEEEDGRNG